MQEAFGATSTTDNVLAGIDLAGKRVLVTGVSAGLGVETARALAAHGAEVIGAARDLAKARAANASIMGGGIRGRFDLVELDLASLASVRACADLLVAAGRPLDLVIANAGVMATPSGHTEDGFEMQFGTNHLGHFVLVNRIASLIAPGGRVVCVSSSGHRFSDVDLDDPGFERTAYDPWLAYGRSKTANILFAVEFDGRYKASNIRATALHPGGGPTELGRHVGIETLKQRIADINADLAAKGQPPYRWKTIPQCAATSVWAGVVADADAVGGRFCENCHLSPINEGVFSPVTEGVKSYALDRARAAALWAKSEAMVGEHFPAPATCPRAGMQVTNERVKIASSAAAG